MKLILRLSLAMMLLVFGPLSCKSDGEGQTDYADACERFCLHLEDCDSIPCAQSDIDLCVSNMGNRPECQQAYVEYADCVQSVGCGDYTECTNAYRDAGCL